MSEWEEFWTDLFAYWPQILDGLGQTILLAGCMTVTGFIGGILVFYLSLSPRRLVRKLTEGYISFFIGMPLIVLLFLVYYGLPEWGVRLSPFTVALLGFTFNVAAYNARYLTTAYNGLDQREFEAARAQGFGPVQTFRLIILPQVLQLSIPALTNQAILNIKDSTVAFLIQYTEFFAQMQELASRDFRYFKVYALTGAVYLLMVSLAILVARRLERRFAPAQHRKFS